MMRVSLTVRVLFSTSHSGLDRSSDGVPQWLDVGCEVVQIAVNVSAVPIPLPILAAFPNNRLSSAGGGFIVCI